MTHYQLLSRCLLKYLQQQISSRRGRWGRCGGCVVVGGGRAVCGSGSSWRTTITTTAWDDGETKKKYGENDEYMFHLVSYWCIRRTKDITPIGLFYKNEIGSTENTKSAETFTKSIRKYDPPLYFCGQTSQIFPILLKIVSTTLFLKVRSITTLVVRVE